MECVLLRLLNETNPKEQLQNVPETAGEIPLISAEEIRNQLSNVKGNKACGQDLIPIEVWEKMGEEGIVFLKKELNEMLTSGIPSSQYFSVYYYFKWTFKLSSYFNLLLFNRYGLLNYLAIFINLIA